ncbi:MAG: PAS domain-containing protein [Candidatus Thermoplasmatota archaeon]|nr:PAS domain-containing protein [Candidatus Thermoplasmatota archaeon]
MKNKLYAKKPLDKFKALLNFADLDVDDYMDTDRKPKNIKEDEICQLANIRSVITQNMKVLSSSPRFANYFDDSQTKVKNENKDEKMWLIMKDLLDSWPDAIFFKNRIGELVLVNNAHAMGMRSKFTDVIGKTDRDLFSKEEADLMIKDDEYVMTTGNPIIDKVEYITFGDGTRHYVSITKVPRKDEHGNIIGLMGISRDVTDNLYQTLFSNYKGCIFITTKEGKWFDINEEGVRMFGYKSREEFLAHTKVHDVYFDTKDRENYMKNIERLGGVKNYEMTLRKKDGSTIDVQITATVIIRDNKVWGYNGTIRDITDERQLQKENQKKITDLTRTIARLKRFILSGITNSLKVFMDIVGGKEANLMDGLTAKQKELFPLFILGKSDSEIAGLTNLTEQQVSKYRYEIYKQN